MIDLVASSWRGGAPLAHPAINAESVDVHRGVIAFPHPLAWLLAAILRPIEGALGIREAAAVVLRPASDFGARALEELRDQTLNLLRFVDPPREIFGRQLAFNLIPQDSLGAVAEPDLARRLSTEAGRLLGWEATRLSVSLIVVPVFHGHAMSVRLDLGSHATISEVRSALDPGTDGSLPAAETATTPAEAAVDRSRVLSEPREDGRGGFWLWTVAGDAGATWARQAVELARAVAGL